MSIPRMASRLSTFWSDSWNFTYIVTTGRIISVEEAERAGWFARADHGRVLAAASQRVVHLL